MKKKLKASKEQLYKVLVSLGYSRCKQRSPSKSEWRRKRFHLTVEDKNPLILRLHIDIFSRPLHKVIYERKDIAREMNRIVAACKGDKNGS